jgi:hypothetical protein
MPFGEVGMLSPDEITGIITMLQVARATSEEGEAHLLADLIACALAEAVTLQRYHVLEVAPPN